MSNPGQASELALRTWTWARRQVAPGVNWVKGITHSPRRAALSGCAVILLIIAIVTPLSRGDVIDSVQFSIAFFATLLTGEAVIFALSFSPSSAWPSLREIDSCGAAFRAGALRVRLLGDGGGPAPGTRDHVIHASCCSLMSARADMRFRQPAGSTGSLALLATAGRSTLGHRSDGPWGATAGAGSRMVDGCSSSAAASRANVRPRHGA